MFYSMSATASSALQGHAYAVHRREDNADQRHAATSSEMIRTPSVSLPPTAAS